MHIEELCQSCHGACCRVWDVTFDPDYERVPKKLSRTAGPGCFGHGRMMVRAADGACVALEDGLCTIYEDRPTLCRDFEAGSDECDEARAAYRV